MKAVFLNEFGGPQIVQWGDLPEPQTLAGTVKIRIKAAALNHLDIWVRKGVMKGKIALPHILGSDGAGEVIDVGDTVTQHRIGDTVIINSMGGCGHCEMCQNGEDSLCSHYSILGEHTNGCFSEIVVVPEHMAWPKPKHLTFEEAAAFPLTFVTAWRMLITKAQIKPSDSILIQGIGGGVAIAALQIAKHVGCKIFVTSGSEEKLNVAKSMGADHTIHHPHQDVVTEVRNHTDKRGVDVVVDSVGGAMWQPNLKCLRRGGKLVTCGSTTGNPENADIPRIFGNQLTIMGSTMGNIEDFRAMLKWVSQNQIHPIIDQVFPADQFHAAQARMENKQQFGKVVIRFL